MRARVKEGNSYGWQPPGTIVEVEPEELARVPWCLEAVPDDVLAGAAPAPIVADEPLSQSPAVDLEQESAPTVPVEDVSPSSDLAPARGKKGRRP